jgi:hypothetical protein
MLGLLLQDAYLVSALRGNKLLNVWCPMHVILKRTTDIDGDNRESAMVDTVHRVRHCHLHHLGLYLTLRDECLLRAWGPDIFMQET